MTSKHNHTIKINKLRIVNFVVTFSFGCLLDVIELSKKCRHIIMMPNSFASGVGRFLNPSCVFFMFSSGKVVITGLKKPIDGEIAAVLLCNILKTKGEMPFVSINNYQIRNSTLSTSLGFRVNIFQMYKDHPELILKSGNYPNITIKSDSSVSLTVPTSGKVNVIGATTLKMAKEAFESAIDGFKEYKII